MGYLRVLFLDLYYFYYIINDLPNAVPDGTIKLFADDSNLFVSDHDLVRLEVKTNKCLTEMQHWFTLNGLTINASKTSYTIFSRSTNKIHKFNFTLTISNQVISRTNNVKYLGVFLDSTFSWKPHIDYIYNKLLKFVPLFYRARKIVTRPALKNLYFAFVYPLLNSGIELYVSGSSNYVSKLHIINNKILRILQFKDIRTPIIELYNNYNTLDLYHLFRYKLLLFVHKWFYYKNNLPLRFANYFSVKQTLTGYNTRYPYDLYVIQCKSNLFRSSFKFQCIILWNALPEELRSIPSHSIFSIKLKSLLSAL